MNKMFSYIKSELEEESSKTGYLLNSLEKVLRLMDILNLISKHPFLKNCFVLKGGTALNVFYLDLPRLSVDADLNYIKEVEKSAMKRDRVKIDGLLPELLAEEYNVTLSKKEYALSQFELRYDTLSRSRDLIKLEINYLHRLPMMELNEMEINKLGSRVKFKVLGFEELIASKVITFLSRYTPRDLYDLYQFSIIDEEINKNLLRNLVYYYGIISREIIFNLFDPIIDTITEHSIKIHLYPMLTKNDRPDLTVMKSSVLQFISPYIELKERQIKIIKDFYKLGILDVSNIFTDKKLSQKVLKSPNYNWKSENIQQKIQKMN
jgi:predicted nucleotidyltransferase component of viral defense system